MDEPIVASDSKDDGKVTRPQAQGGLQHRSFTQVG
jgi:hypothetical protein